MQVLAQRLTEHEPEQQRRRLEAARLQQVADDAEGVRVRCAAAATAVPGPNGTITLTGRVGQSEE